MAGREVLITRNRGEGSLSERNGLPRAFYSTCLGFRDSAGPGTGRCVWADSNEDEIFIETTR